VGRKEIHKIWKKFPIEKTNFYLAKGCIADRIIIPLIAFLKNDDKNNIIVIIQ
jgi:hypothetical protein